MKKVITIAGSTSQKSINKKLLNYTSGLLDTIENIPIDLNDYELPIYSVDFENYNGMPTAAKRLNEQLDRADGFIIALAEHNGSYTSAFKNTLDWLSRLDIKIWRDKPMLLMSTSPGARGGATVLQTAMDYFPYLGGKVVADFSLPSFFQNFSEHTISNPDSRNTLIEKVQLFQEHLNSIASD